MKRVNIQPYLKLEQPANQQTTKFAPAKVASLDDETPKKPKSVLKRAQTTKSLDENKLKVLQDDITPTPQRTPSRLTWQKRSISLDARSFPSKAAQDAKKTSTLNGKRSNSEDLKKRPAVNQAPTLDFVKKSVDYNKLAKKGRSNRISDTVQGLLARLMFMCHAALGAILVIGMGKLGYPFRYFILIVLGPQLVEAIVTLVYRKGKEWRWVTPCIMFHITATAPMIWVLELTEVEQRLIKKESNMTNIVCVPIDPITQGRKGPFKDLDDWSRYMIEEFCHCGNCIQIMVQLLLLLLVIGRWLCPRSGTVSMAQKAVMLFHNFAVTSDILDLYRLLNEETVKTDPMLVTVTLCLFTSGIIQIGIVVTEKKEGSKACGACLENGVWSILAVLILDDIPFLVFRFVLIIYYRVFSYTIFFFTCKNLLLTALNTNKLIAIAHEHNTKVKDQRKADLFKPFVNEMNKGTALVKINIDASMLEEPDTSLSDVPNELMSALH